MADQYDAVVIGGGPGGYNAAIRLGQLGFKSVCIDKRGAFGGTCLNIGCIPSKALLHVSELYDQALNHMPKLGVKTTVELDLAVMMAHKDKVVSELTRGVEFLFKKYKTEGLVGEARITAPGRIEVKTKDGMREIETKHVIIATGSEVATLPQVTIDEQKVVSSTGALSLKEVPRRLLVVGGGYIGLELGSVWRRLGSEVLVVEFLDRITPGLDGEVAKQFQRILQKQGMKFQLSTKVVGVEKKNDVLSVTVEPAAGGDKQTIETDIMLVSIGRRPFVDNLGLEKAGVRLDGRGRIVTDNHYATNISGIWAIGDCREGAMLAHKAEDEAMACVAHIAGKSGHVNYDAIPAVVYTAPEVASVGKTEEEVKTSGIEYKIGKFPFTANARAKTVAATDGFVKLIADTKTDRVLGVHIMCVNAGEMIEEAALAIELGCSAEDIALTSHAHPTMTEAVRQAALGAYDKTTQI